MQGASPDKVYGGSCKASIVGLYDYSEGQVQVEVKYCMPGLARDP